MDTIAILLAIVFLVNLAFATLLVVNRGGKNGAGYYAVVASATVLWVLAEFIFYVLPIDSLLTQIAARLLYLMGVVFSPYFMFFCYVFLSKEKMAYRTRFIELSAPAIFLAVLIIGTNKIIGNAYLVNTVHSIAIGDWYPLYIVVVCAYFGWGFVKLFWRYAQTKTGSMEWRQFMFIFIGSVLSISSGLLFNVLLPYINSFQFFFIGPLLVVIFIGCTTAAIFRYQIFNVKVIATNILVLLLWSVLLVRALLSGSASDLITDGIVLIVSIPVGIMLIRSVIKEVATRERVEALAKELAEANTKLETLNRQKSEFVSIASHQLRTPLTAIKGYSSMLLEGSFGTLEEKAKEAVSRVFESSERLVAIVEDFLNLSRIELGRMQYEFSSVDLKKMVREVCEELQKNAHDKNLTLTMGIPEGEPWMIWADAGKVRQVISNIIDNAIKYTPKGSVAVKLEKKGSQYCFSSTDTGIGLLKADIARLFEKYVRTAEAKRTVAGGSGLGLFVANQIMKAHQSEIVVTSPGPKKGSTFSVSFDPDSGNHATISEETKASILAADADNQPTETATGPLGL